MRPRPFIAVWPRDRGKSTNGEASVIDLAGRGKRLYIIYVRETQDQADQSISNIQAMIEDSKVREYYPELAQVRQSKISGGSKGWRRERLASASGVTIEGIGFDTAKRGARELEQRPDMIIFDDIDNRLDSEATIKKKYVTFTQTLIPMGSKDCAFFFLQNVIIKDGICARLCGVSDQPSDALIDRIVSGPYVDVINPEFEEQMTEHNVVRKVIVGGELTWPELGLEGIQATIDKNGFASWKSENQQQVGDAEEALWERATIERFRVTRDEVPVLSEIVVAIDPPATTGQAGIIIKGAAYTGSAKHGYMLEDATTPYGAKPTVWATAAIEAFERWKKVYPGARIKIVGEVNNGGDMIETTLRNIENAPDFDYEAVRATRGKIIRAEPSSVVMEEGRMHHVGEFTSYENELCGWIPGMDSPNRLDAGVWADVGLGLEPTVDVAAWGGMVIKE